MLAVWTMNLGTKKLAVYRAASCRVIMHQGCNPRAGLAWDEATKDMDHIGRGGGLCRSFKHRDDAAVFGW